MRNRIASHAHRSETELLVRLRAEGTSPGREFGVKCWCALIPSVLVLSIATLGYTAESTLDAGSQPTSGRPATPMLAPPVDPSESILSEYTPQAPPNPK